MSNMEYDLDNMRKDLFLKVMSRKLAMKKTKSKKATRPVKPVPTIMTRTKRYISSLKMLNIEAAYTPAAFNKTKKSKRARDYEAP
ncbi:hypothetical protein [Parasitella parasitica]|uniref:Uncharacterized protein n=1 Tax=Parasitella parasitica TaxID=35722 RepID=A0A0B7N7N4_9FUNG|nr:hypothetical protein [Parasitella parasitica]